MEGKARRASREMVARAKELRRASTPAEVALWNGLRGWGVGKFRRQHPLDRFVLDFYHQGAKLCVELDGGVHDTPDQRARDEARTAALEAMGVRVLRFRNEDVLGDTAGVMRRIKRELERRLYSPLPLAGEGGGSQPAG
jgi:very-short-patch-repair endonuclease